MHDIVNRAVRSYILPRPLRNISSRVLAPPVAPFPRQCAALYTLQDKKIETGQVHSHTDTYPYPSSLTPAESSRAAGFNGNFFHLGVYGPPCMTCGRDARGRAVKLMGAGIRRDCSGRWTAGRRRCQKTTTKWWPHRRARFERRLKLRGC